MRLRADKKLIDLRGRPLPVFLPNVVVLPLIPIELQAPKVVKVFLKTMKKSPAECDVICKWGHALVSGVIF